MNLQDIKIALNDDLAFNWSIDNNDIRNMQLVLRAYGYDYSFEDASNIIAYCDNTFENIG